MKDDFFVADQSGILSSVLTGPDYRTRITEKTEEVLYVAYGIEGVTHEQIRHHLSTIGHYLKEVIPNVQVSPVHIFS